MKRFLTAFGLIFAAILTMAVAAQALPARDLFQYMHTAWFSKGLVLVPAPLRTQPPNYNNSQFSSGYPNGTTINVATTICDAPSDAAAGTWSQRSAGAGLTTSEVITIDAAQNWSGYNAYQPTGVYLYAPRVFNSGSGLASSVPTGSSPGPGDSCTPVLDAATSASNQVLNLGYSCAVLNSTAATLYVRLLTVGPVTPKTGMRCVQIEGS